MHQLLLTIPLVLALALASCGGTTPPPNDAAAPDKSAPSGSGSESAALEQERKDFIDACKESPELDSFCVCSWDNVSKATTAEERKDVENPNTKKALAGLAEQCGDKLPEKYKFMKGCAKSPAMAPLCECSFRFLEGKGLLKSEAIDKKTEAEMKAACTTEAYEYGKAIFLEACGQNQPATVCECTFAALEKKFGKTKLQSMLDNGSPEVASATQAAAKTCGAK